MIDKKTVRDQMKEQLMMQSEAERDLKSDAILNRVIKLDEWKDATCIGITISREFEVNTRKLIEQAWREGKQVAVPKCIPATREMEFYLISSFSQLEIVYAGLLEPTVGKTELISPSEIDLLILPGIAFTERGDRLGFGGGYYDRFLPTYKRSLIALAFDFQLLDFFPVESHDLPVRLIVTEKRIINV